MGKINPPIRELRGNSKRRFWKKNGRSENLERNHLFLKRNPNAAICLPDLENNYFCISLAGFFFSPCVVFWVEEICDDSSIEQVHRRRRWMLVRLLRDHPQRRKTFFRTRFFLKDNVGNDGIVAKLIFSQIRRGKSLFRKIFHFLYPRELSFSVNGVAAVFFFLFLFFLSCSTLSGWHFMTHRSCQFVALKRQWRLHL